LTIPVRIDRVQLVTHDRPSAAARWARLFGAEPVRDDRVSWLGAERSVLRAGATDVELLEPDGIGAVAQHLARRRSAILALGLAVADLESTRAGLDARGVHHQVEGAQLWISGEWLGVPGLRIVLSQDAPVEPAGLLGRVYEGTHLSRTYPRAADRLAKVFDLDPGLFVPIRSQEFGYEGLLTLFARDRLDRIEAVTPTDPGKTMGRFFAREGPCFYMIYAEARDASAIRDRLLEHAPDHFTGPREGAAVDNLFVHPRALDGVLLGVSRDTVAWRWSGQPQRTTGV
jgi:hypothetical protein